MKLFFHSDQTVFNNPVDAKIFSILNPKTTKIGYIPSTSDTTRKYFNRTKGWYMQYGVNSFFYFDLGDEYNEENIKELLSCDLIHLSGGDTIAFAKNIIKRNFKEILTEFLKDGGILVGISAGSYVMTPHFKIRKIYKEELISDENLEGMSLVDFEFLPHLQEKEQYMNKFIEYSNNNKGRTIYLCEDNNGLFVQNHEIEILGKAIILKDGEFVS